MPFLAQDAVFKRLSEIAEVGSMTKDERREYDESLRISWIGRNLPKKAIDFARNKQISGEICLKTDRFRPNCLPVSKDCCIFAVLSRSMLQWKLLLEDKWK